MAEAKQTFVNRAPELMRTTPVFILSDKSQEHLARAIVKFCDEWQTRASKEWKDHETRRVEYKDIICWKTFHDGFPDIFIRDVKDIAGKDIIFVASFHSVNVIFAQISLIYQIPRYLAHSCTVILPYFPTGTMERIDNEGQVATAKTLAMILSEIPPSARGPSQIMIFDIHALQERFYFKDNVIPRLESAVPLIVQTIQKTYEQKSERFAVVFPDDGAEKRFSNNFPEKWTRITFTKRREGEKRIVEPKGNCISIKDVNVVIVDDLVQTGGTLLETAKLLKEMGAKSINAYVTHAVFPNESWRKFISTYKQSSIFNAFWITDSIPHANEIAKHQPFKILSLAPVIADILLGFDLKLFN